MDSIRSAADRGRHGVVDDNARARVAWIGRWTGPKGEIARRLLREVVPRFPTVEFTFVGGPIDEELKAQAPRNVRLTGFVSDVAAVMREHSAVIGGGRVPLEAIRLGIPVIAVGESCYIGPITADTIVHARSTNFGDCAVPPESFDVARLIDDLMLVLNVKPVLSAEALEHYLRDYDPERVHEQILRVYGDALIDRYLDRFAELPVLTYHRVVSEPPQNSRFKIYVTREELDSQLASLKARGFETITFRDIVEGKRPRKPVILTFDDGYVDNHENLLPLLERHDAKAVVFALGDRAVRHNAWDVAHGEPQAALMDDDQLRACHASGRIEIGSHGLQHRRLQRLSDGELWRELVESKHALESLLGSEVMSFAYPYGEYGDREAVAVRRAGYRFGIGTVNGPLRIGEDRFRIRRITIFADSGRIGFWKKTSGFYLRYCKLKGKDF